MMPLTIDKWVIQSVCIVDDDEGSRKAFSYPVEEMHLTPAPASGPLPQLEDFVRYVRQTTQAALCDHQLKVKTYADFNGSAAVARLYQEQFPAVLCTRFEAENIDDIRPKRQFIPVVLNVEELDPISLKEGFAHCIQEFMGVFRPSRRPWRVLIRVEAIDQERNLFYFIVPSWDADRGLRLPLTSVSSEVSSRILKGQIRFHAQVNAGAERAEDLYFEDWEHD